jgi:hypothetical protein
LVKTLVKLRSLLGESGVVVVLELLLGSGSLVLEVNDAVFAVLEVV